MTDHTTPISTSIPHDSAVLHVTGGARYVDDLPMPKNGLVIVPGLSTVASGVITSLDLDDVRASDGIVAVLTAKDIPGVNDVSPVFGDDPMLGTVIFPIMVRSSMPWLPKA